MPKPTELPGLFSVGEIAAHFSVSRTEILRRIARNVYPGVVRIGNQCLIMSPNFAEVVARGLPADDERRKVQDEVDGLLAKDTADAQKEQAELEKDRKRRMSPRGLRERAQREVAERDAAYRDRPEFGTALGRTKILRFHAKGPSIGERDAISDAQTTAADIVGADPNRGKPPGARNAYVLSDLTDLTDTPRTSTLADISGNGSG